MTATDVDRTAAERLYDGFARSDPTTILSALHPQFRGIVSAGMPHGVGGSYEGPEQMLRECWGVVFQHYDIAPRPREMIGLDDGRLLVLGDYTGVERATGRQVSAAFAHVLRLSEGRIVELRQITDTASW